MVVKSYDGVPMYEDPFLTVEEGVEVKRGWWERIFSLNPWKATKTELIQVPDPEVYMVAPPNFVGMALPLSFSGTMPRNEYIVGHPVTIAKLLKGLRDGRT